MAIGPFPKLSKDEWAAKGITSKNSQEVFQERMADVYPRILAEELANTPKLGTQMTDDNLIRTRKLRSGQTAKANLSPTYILPSTDASNLYPLAYRPNGSEGAIVPPTPGGGTYARRAKVEGPDYTPADLAIAETNAQTRAIIELPGGRVPSVQFADGKSMTPEEAIQKTQLEAIQRQETMIKMEKASGFDRIPLFNTDGSAVIDPATNRPKYALKSKPVETPEQAAVRANRKMAEGRASSLMGKMSPIVRNAAYSDPSSGIVAAVKTMELVSAKVPGVEISRADLGILEGNIKNFSHVDRARIQNFIASESERGLAAVDEARGKLRAGAATNPDAATWKQMSKDATIGVPQREQHKVYAFSDEITPDAVKLDQQAEKMAEAKIREARKISEFNNSPEQKEERTRLEEEQRKEVARNYNSNFIRENADKLRDPGMFSVYGVDSEEELESILSSKDPSDTRISRIIDAFKGNVNEYSEVSQKGEAAKLVVTPRGQKTNMLNKDWDAATAAIVGRNRADPIQNEALKNIGGVSASSLKINELDETKTLEKAAEEISLISKTPVPILVSGGVTGDIARSTMKKMDEGMDFGQAYKSTILENKSRFVAQTSGDTSDEKIVGTYIYGAAGKSTIAAMRGIAERDESQGVEKLISSIRPLVSQGIKAVESLSLNDSTTEFAIRDIKARQKEVGPGYKVSEDDVRTALGALIDATAMSGIPRQAQLYVYDSNEYKNKLAQFQIAISDKLNKEYENDTREKTARVGEIVDAAKSAQLDPTQYNADIYVKDGDKEIFFTTEEDRKFFADVKASGDENAIRDIGFAIGEASRNASGGGIFAPRALSQNEKMLKYKDLRRIPLVDSFQFSKPVNDDIQKAIRPVDSDNELLNDSYTGDGKWFNQYVPNALAVQKEIVSIPAIGKTGKRTFGALTKPWVDNLRSSGIGQVADALEADKTLGTSDVQALLVFAAGQYYKSKQEEIHRELGPTPFVSSVAQKRLELSNAITPPGARGGLGYSTDTSRDSIVDISKKVDSFARNERNPLSSRIRAIKKFESYLDSAQISTGTKVGELNQFAKASSDVRDDMESARSIARSIREEFVPRNLIENKIRELGSISINNPAFYNRDESVDESFRGKTQTTMVGIEAYRHAIDNPSLKESDDVVKAFEDVVIPLIYRDILDNEYDERP